MSEVVSLASSSNGRVSGKPWKERKTATVSMSSRSHLPLGVKTKSWEARMQKTQKSLAIKKLENELKDDRKAELERRREVTAERKRIQEEKLRLEEAKAQMGARKAARMRRRAGRTKKINH
uniref:rRNA-processing protein n=1 Tax=Psilocybe cubensis TaxID=181762 RepID=A0A8H7Y7A4_PSICU